MNRESKPLAHLRADCERGEGVSERALTPEQQSALAAVRECVTALNEALIAADRADLEIWLETIETDSHTRRAPMMGVYVYDALPREMETPRPGGRLRL